MIETRDQTIVGYRFLRNLLLTLILSKALEYLSSLTGDPEWQKFWVTIMSKSTWYTQKLSVYGLFTLQPRCMSSVYTSLMTEKLT